MNHQPQEKQDEEATELPDIRLDGLIAEPFYYQMQNLVLWQALNFWYQRTSLDGYLKENAWIFPQQATVMVAMVELPALAPTHALVKEVCGFDHSYLDHIQQEWYTHLYPYQINAYQHRILSLSQAACVFDYRNKVSSIAPQTVHLQANTNGLCHALAIWVNYDLSPGYSIQHYNEDTREFLSYQKVMLRFLKQPVECIPDHSNCGISCTVEFDSDSSLFHVNVSSGL